MTPTSPSDVTRLLLQWSEGDREALDELTPLVYEELQRLASRYLRRERADHTLETSALANEAYLVLVDQNRVRWQNRAHFFAIASQTMRRILVEHARKRHSLKRGGGQIKLPLDEDRHLAGERAPHVLVLDEALEALTEVDPLKGKLVEMRFFGGLTNEEIAEVLDVSPRTVRRQWRASKMWLQRFLTEDSP